MTALFMLSFMPVEDIGKIFQNGPGNVNGSATDQDFETYNTTEDTMNFTIETFESHGTGEIVANQYGSTWAAEAADDDLASVVTVGALVDTKSLRIHDESKTTQASVTKTLPITIGAGDIFRIGAIKPVTGDYASDYLEIKLREAASVIVWLRLLLTTGVLYYSTDSGTSVSTTGKTLALDAINYDLDVEMTSIGASSTFKVRINAGAWSSALAADNDATSGITKVEFTSNEANNNGGTYEDFSSYTNDIDIGGQSGPIGSWTSDNSVGCYTKTASGKLHHYDNTGAGHAYSKVTLTSHGTCGGSDMAEWTSHIDVGTPWAVAVYEEANQRVVLAWGLSGNKVQSYSTGAGGYIDTGITYSASTDEVYELLFFSTTQCKLRKDGGAWSAAFNIKSTFSAGAVISDLAFDWTTGGTTDVYLDNIRVTWIYTAGDIDVYVDDLVDDMYYDAGTYPYNFTVDTIETHASGEIVANQVGTSWAAESGDDDLATVVTVGALVDTKSLRVHDESKTAQASVTKTLPITVEEDDIFRIGKIKPVTGDYASDYLEIKLREAASVIIWLRLLLTTGVLYYSTDSGSSVTTTGVTLTLDAVNTNLDVEMTSIGISSTFRVRLNGGSWSSAFVCDNDASVGITKVEFTSKEVNDDGLLGIDEPFTGYTSSEIVGQSKPTTSFGTWSYDAASDDGTYSDFVGAQSVGGYTCAKYSKTTSISIGWREFNLDTASATPSAVAQYAYIDTYVNTRPAGADNPVIWIGYDSTPGNRKIDLWGNDDGNWWYYDGAAKSTGIARIGTAAWYRIGFQFLASTWYFNVGGGSWNGPYNCVGGAWGSGVKYFWLGCGGGAYAEDLYFDNINATWTSPVAGDIDVYVDSLYDLNTGGVANMTSYTAFHEPESTSTITTRVSLDPDGVNKCFNLTDNDIEQQYDVGKTLLHSYGIHETISMKVWPVTAGYDACLVYIDYVEDGDDKIRLQMNQHDGVVKYYYGSWLTATGFTVTLDDWSYIHMKMVTDCTFNLSHDESTWYGPFNASIRVDDAIDEITFLSPSDNLYPVAETGAERFDYTPQTETFESYGEGHDMFGHQTLIGDLSADPGANVDLTTVTEGSSFMLKHTQTGKAGTDRAFDMTFDANQMTIAGATLSWTWRLETGSDPTMYFLGKAAAAAYCAVGISEAGGIMGFDNAAWVALSPVLSISANVNYEMSIIVVDSTHFDIKVGSTTYTNGGAHWHTNGATAMDNMYGWRYYTWASGSVNYIDNVVLSWTGISHRVSSIGTWSHPSPAASCYTNIVNEGVTHPSAMRVVDGSAAGGPGDLSLNFTDAGNADGVDYFEFNIKPSATPYSVLFYEPGGTGGAYRINLYLDSADNKIKSGTADSGLTWAAGTWVKIGVLFFSTTQCKMRKDGGAWSAALNQYASWSGSTNVIGRVGISLSTPGTVDNYYDDYVPSWMYVAAHNHPAPMTLYIDDVGENSLPDATFTANATTIVAGQAVAFTHSGTHGDLPETYQWYFGEGANVTTEDATHTYSSAGTYSVTLTVVDTDGEKSVHRHTNSIVVGVDVAPSAAFSANDTTIIQGMSALFTHSGGHGNGSLTFQWDFGDSTANVTTESPTHFYMTAGTFTVTLTVVDLDYDKNVEKKVSYMVVSADVAPSASFTANVTSIVAGQSIAFTHDGSNGNPTATYQWYFGDSTANVTTESPTHQFTVAGTYTVTLTLVDGDFDKDVHRHTNSITVAADSSPDATFIGNSTTIVAGQSVLFTHTGSHGNLPETYQWYFGDLTANVTTEDVTHQFVNAGTYTVTLTMVDTDYDKNVHRHTNYIVVGVDATPDATFTANDTTIIQGMSALFTHSGGHGNLSETYQWDFGDGSENATTENPVHFFMTAGTFTVTLTMVDLDYDQSVHRHVDYIVVSADICPDASFSGNWTEIVEGQSVLFTHSGSNGNPSTTYQWYFGEGVNATTENPTHQYNTAGTYTVTLTIVDGDFDKNVERKVGYIIVSAEATPDATFIANVTTIVAGQSVSFTHTGGHGNSPDTYQWYFGEGANVTTEDAVHQYASAGTYTVTLTMVDVDLDKNVHRHTNYIVVGVDVAPSGAFSGNVTSVIAGQSVAFTHSGSNGNGSATYQWYFGDGTGNMTTENPTHQYGVAGTYTVTLTVVDLDFDKDVHRHVDYITVTEDILPDALFLIDDTSIVEGQTVMFTHTGSNGNPTASYQWYFGEGVNVTTENPTHTYNTAGSYQVTLTVVDGDFDKSVYRYPFNVTVEAEATPDATFIGNATTIVAGQTVSFTHTGGHGNSPDTYQWYFGEGVNSTTEDATHTYSVAGTFTVTLTMVDVDLDKNVHRHTNYIVVGVDVAPSAAFSANDTTIIQGMSALFSHSGGHGNGSLTFQWDFGDGSANVTTENPVHFFTTAGTFTVTLTVVDLDYDKNVEKKAAYIAVSSDDSPDASFTGNWTTIVAGDTVAFTHTGSNGNPTASYQWYFGEGANVTTENPTHQFNVAGTYTVTLTLIDGDFDKNVHRHVDYITVAADAAPDATFTGNVTTIVAGQSVAFTHTGGHGNSPDTYQWYFGEGVNVTTEDAVHQYASAGTYTVTLTMVDVDYDKNVHRHTNYIVVGVDVAPDATFVANDTTIIQGMSALFTHTGGHGNLSETYQWYFGDGSANETAEDVTHFFTTAGTFTVTLTIVDLDYDKNVHRHVDYIVVSSDVCPDASFSANWTSIVEGQSVSFTHDGSNGNPTATYQWYFGEGANVTTESPTHQYNTAGTYTVTLTIVDADFDKNVHRHVDYITVEAEAAPDATFIGNTTAIVAGQSVAFTHTGGHGNAPDTYQWYFGEGVNVTTEDAVHQYAVAGTYTVTLTMVDVDLDKNVHRHTNYIVVGVDVAPDAGFSANDTTIIAGQSVAFTHSGSNGNGSASYQWYFGDGTGNVTTESPTHQYGVAGTYTVTLTIVDLDFDKDVERKVNYITVAADVCPTASFSANWTSIIAGQSVDFTYEGVSGNAPTTYQWYFGDLTANVTTDDVTHQFLNAGTYTVTLTVVDADYDKAIERKVGYITVAADASPDATFTGNTTVIVAGQSVSFTHTGADANGPETYQWYFGEGANVTTEDATHQYNVAGTYTVTLTIVDADFDKNVHRHVDYIVVGVDVAPTADFSGNDTTIIAGGYVAFTHSGSNGNGSANYQWSFGDGTGNETVENPTHQFSNDGTYTVTLTVVDLDFDKAVEKKVGYITVSGDDVPDASFSANVTSIAAGEYVSFTHLGDNGNAPTTYQWYFGDLTANVTTENPTHQFLNAGTYTVTMTIVDADFDKNVERKVGYITVVADSVPDASFTANATVIVAGQSINFTHSGSHGNLPETYQWYFGDSTANETMEDATHQFLNAGTYTVTLTMVDSDSDKDVHRHVNYIVVGVDVAPSAAFAGNDTAIIEGQSILFTHSGGHGNGSLTFQWDFGDGAANSTVENPVHFYHVPGTYTVTLTVVDLDYDKSVEKKVDYVTVLTDLYPDASFTANSTTIVVGYSVSFTHVGVSGNAPSTYQWYFGDLTANETTQNAIHFFATAGVFTITFTIVDSNLNESIHRHVDYITVLSLSNVAITSISVGNGTGTYVGGMVFTVVVTFSNTGGTSATIDAVLSFGGYGWLTPDNPAGVLIAAAGTQTQVFLVTSSVLSTTSAVVISSTWSGTESISSRLISGVSGAIHLDISMQSRAVLSITGMAHTSGTGTYVGGMTFSLSVSFSNTGGTSATGTLAVVSYNGYAFMSSNGSAPLTVAAGGTGSISFLITIAGAATSNASVLITSSFTSTESISYRALSGSAGANHAHVAVQSKSAGSITAMAYTTGNGTYVGGTSFVLRVTVANTGGTAITATLSTLTYSGYLYAYSNVSSSATVPAAGSAFIYLNVSFAPLAVTNATVHVYSAWSGTEDISGTAVSGTSGAIFLDVSVLADIIATANFTANVTSVWEHDDIQFNSTGVDGNGPTYYEWNFNDGTGNVTTKNPVHDFALAGVYTVLLTVEDFDNDTDTETKVGYIVVVAKTVPSAPSITNATRGNHTVWLIWSIPLSNGGNPILGYNVYCAGFAPVTLGNVTAYTYTGLTNGQTYRFKVQAFNVIGNGTNSTELAFLLASVPTAPRHFYALATGTIQRLLLVWQIPISDGGSPILGYRIDKGTELGQDAQYYVTVYGEEVTSYFDYDIDFETTYFYHISAFNAVGEGPEYNTMTITTPLEEVDWTWWIIIAIAILSIVILFGVSAYFLKKKGGRTRGGKWMGQDMLVAACMTKKMKNDPDCARMRLERKVLALLNPKKNKARPKTQVKKSVKKPVKKKSPARKKKAPANTRMKWR